MSDKNKAIDFLLLTNEKFQCVAKKPIVIVKPELYFKKYLDLYLPSHIAGSTFNYKP